MASESSGPASSESAPSYSKHPFILPIDQLTRELETDLDTGLSVAKARSLQKKYGTNRLNDDEGVKWYRLLFKQISNAMILVRWRTPHGQRRAM